MLAFARQHGVVACTLSRSGTAGGTGGGGRCWCLLHCPCHALKVRDSWRRVREHNSYESACRGRSADVHLCHRATLSCKAETTHIQTCHNDELDDLGFLHIICVAFYKFASSEHELLMAPQPVPCRFRLYQSFTMPTWLALQQHRTIAVGAAKLIQDSNPSPRLILRYKG